TARWKGRAARRRRDVLLVPRHESVVQPSAQRAAGVSRNPVEQRGDADGRLRLRAAGAGANAHRLYRDRYTPADPADRSGERELRAPDDGNVDDSSRLPRRVGFEP